MKECLVRRQNWVPLPLCARLLPTIAVNEVDMNDLFPKALVLSFMPLTGMGTLLTAKGEEIPFNSKYLELAGTKKLEDLNAGMKVGFDLSRVGREKKIKTIKIY